MKLIAYCLIPLVKVNLWLRHWHILEDKWFWADRFCSMHGITVMTRRMRKIGKESLLKLRAKSRMKARLDCEKEGCIHYGGLGCHGADDSMNQTCCRLDLNESTKCLNDPDYPLYKTMDDMSVDEYMKHLKKKWRLDKKAQKSLCLR